MRFSIAAVSLVVASFLCGRVDAAGTKRPAQHTLHLQSTDKRGCYSNGMPKNGSSFRSEPNLYNNDTTLLYNAEAIGHILEEGITFLREKFPCSEQLIVAVENAVKNHSKSDVEAAIINYATVALDATGLTASQYKEVERQARLELKNSMSMVFPEELLNFGDGLMDEILLLIIKHFAPNSSKDYVDPKGDIACKIPRKFSTGKAKKGDGGNVCIEAYLDLIARSLTKHGGGEWNDGMKQNVNEKVGITDMCVIVTKDTDSHQSEFKSAAEAMKIPLDLLHSVGFLFMVAQVKYNHLRRPEEPLKVLCASAAAFHLMFGDAEPYSNDILIFLGQSVHGQCVAMKLPLRNVIVWPTTLLIEICERVRIAFDGIVPVPPPNTFEYFLRVGKREGKEETDEEREAAIEILREQGRRGGKIVSEAFEAFWSEKTLTPKQENIVIGCMQGGETVREAFRKFRYKEPMTEKERLIVRGCTEGAYKGGEIVRVAFEKYYAKKPMTETEDRIVKECLKGGEIVSVAFEKYHAKKPMTETEDRIVKGCMEGGEIVSVAFEKYHANQSLDEKEDRVVKAHQKRVKKNAVTRGDSDETLDLVCTRLILQHGHTKQCGGRTQGVLTGCLTCPRCRTKSFGYHDNWSMPDKPKPVLHCYECKNSGKIVQGPHGYVVWCCRSNHSLGGVHFKAPSEEACKAFQSTTKQQAETNAKRQAEAKAKHLSKKAISQLEEVKQLRIQYRKGKPSTNEMIQIAKKYSLDYTSTKMWWQSQDFRHT
jgi:hypothetical protein